MEGPLQMIRALALLLLLVAACDRFINLSPPPDAHVGDAARDSVPPDAATLPDAFIPPD
jgi:hypothetical protein